MYICPQKQELTYAATDREGYRQYKSDPEMCKDCPLLSQCTRSRNKQRILTRHVWQGKEWVKQNGRSRSGKYLYRLRYQRLSEVSRMPKSSMDFAIAGSAARKKS